MFSVSALSSAVYSGVILGAQQWQKKLTDSEAQEIVYNADENFRDSSNDSVSSSDIEIDDIVVTDAK